MAHSHGVKAMCHSCGAIILFIDSPIDIGVDILDPLQVRATGMGPKFRKRTYGHHICLHGSIDTRSRKIRPPLD
jgi:uroporphyrinogen decarboxylase